MSFSARTLHLSAEQSSLLASAAVNDAAVNDAAVDDAAVDDTLMSNFVQSLDAHPPRLEAEVLAVKRVGPGAGVSYGHTYRTTTSTTLALVAIGYGHGLPRKAGNRASVTVNGVRMPIVGRVAMDVLVIDAGDASVAAGDRVTFFGDPASAEITLAEWAESVGEHPFSVLACLDHRVSRMVAP